MTRRQLYAIFYSCFLALPPLSAESLYYAVDLSDLEISRTPLPKTSPLEEPARKMSHRRQRERERFMQPYAQGAGSEEIYFAADQGTQGSPWRVRWSLSQNIARTRVLIRAAAKGPVTGTLFLPKGDWAGMVPYTFRVSGPFEDQKAAKKAFFQAKEEHYARLLRQDLPGGAWLRHQHTQAQRMGGADEMDIATPAAERRRESELRRTFSLFSGGRALSENLQLDRRLRVTTDLEATVSLDSLEGITVAEIDWQPIVEGLMPKRDPLAALIPADQHAIFFPSFTSMTELLDEVRAQGTPILRLLDPRSEDALTQQRYEKQLCLPLDQWARLMGPALIESIAMTGSDPYLRTGSDVALLFESTRPGILRTSILAQYGRAHESAPESQMVTGRLLDTDYVGLRSPDRSICSYLASLGRAVVVTNSLQQLKQVIRAHSGKVESVNQLDEYTFFRDRYKRDEPETALLVISDATIRRWCGARWRIGASRRIRAAAAMARLQATHLDAFVKGLQVSTSLRADVPSPFGQLSLSAEGVTSDIYGTLAFQTPIAELAFAQVTPTEAQAYRRYRDRYQRNWRQFFDPIAIRFHIDGQADGRLALDCTVRPLIAASEYNRYIEVTGNGNLTPKAGDPHPESLAQIIATLDRNAPQMRLFGNLAGLMAPGLRANPLGWLGDWVTVYADEDPFWAEFAAARDHDPDSQADAFVEENIHRLPVALQVDVSNPLKLTGFLVALRAFVEQTAPNMTTWETLTHQEQAYVRIRPAQRVRGQSDMLQELALYYAVSPDGLILSLNETLIQKFLDRKLGKSEQGNPSLAGPDWLGQNVALRVAGRGIDLLQALFDQDVRALLRARSWGNLIILNEWQRRYRDMAPLAVHERYWQTRLVCPGGGDYVWNEEFKTLESTVFGCPGRPKQPASLSTPLTRIKQLGMGLTFEDNGLRAKAELTR
ncbi:MAG: hypothetical protein IIC50_11260 [Planctomycetes bacterium]|nr:hypothetical protein [Planctomycetota bacterium]